MEEVVFEVSLDILEGMPGVIAADGGVLSGCLGCRRSGRRLKALTKIMGR